MRPWSRKWVSANLNWQPRKYAMRRWRESMKRMVILQKAMVLVT